MENICNERREKYPGNGRVVFLAATNAVANSLASSFSPEETTLHAFLRIGLARRPVPVRLDVIKKSEANPSGPYQRISSLETALVD